MPTPSTSLSAAEAAAVLMVRSGRSIELAADESGLTVAEVASALQRAKSNREARRTPATVSVPVRTAVPAPRRGAAPDRARAEAVIEAAKKPIDPADLYSLEELCDWGADAGIQRAATLTERIRTAAEELRTMVRRRAEIDSGRAQVADAERTLAEARAKLAALTGAPTPTTADERALIRAWAPSHGHDVAANGKIRADIVAAYRAANP